MNEKLKKKEKPLGTGCADFTLRKMLSARLGVEGILYSRFQISTSQSGISLFASVLIHCSLALM
jgi:hypothetical protein